MTVGRRTGPPVGVTPDSAGAETVPDIETVRDIGRLLRDLRRREARRSRDTELTYRELAARTGWSPAAIGQYLSGRTLPPTDRFDTLVRLLGANSVEQGRLATARDRIEERRRYRPHADPDPPAAGTTATAVRAEPVPPLPPLPRQLPADVPGFVGRVAQLAELDGLLDRTTRSPWAMATLAGTAGIGKTALAVHWAHTVAERFPDGQLYVNLRGFDPSGRIMEPAEAIRGFLDGLNVPPERVPSGLDAQAALYRTMLAGKRILVVLDNARDAEQVRPLLPGSPAAVTVVTSRNQLTGILATDGAHPLTLDVLSPGESRDLLTRRIGDRVAVEPDAARQIIEACARLPLALSVAAVRAQRSGFSLAAIAAELGNAGQRLDALDTGDPASQVRAVFSWSLTSVSPSAARLFRLLGLQPGPDISTAAAAGLAGQGLPETRRQLTELARASLLTEHVPGRFALHDLLHAYATELVHSQDGDHVRRAAVVRLLDHYVHMTHHAERLLNPHTDPIPVPITPAAADVGSGQLSDHRAAMAWLTAEHTVLLAALRRAADIGLHRHTWQLVWGLETVLHRQGHWRERVMAWHIALRAAHELRHPGAQAYAHRCLAWTALQVGQYADANTHLRRALALYTEADDAAGQARAHASLAEMWGRQGHLNCALDHAQNALCLSRAADDLSGQASTLNVIGLIRIKRGDHAEAIVACEQAIALHQQTGNRNGEAVTWDSLGDAHRHAGHLHEAVDCYHCALVMYDDIGNRYHKALTLTNLGDTHRAAGDTVRARTTWARALAILTELDHPEAQAIRRRLL